MKRLFIFAEFDWLENIELVGELTMDCIRGGETYGFKFEPSWLKKHGSLSLSDDLNNYVGMQYGHSDGNVICIIKREVF